MGQVLDLPLFFFLGNAELGRTSNASPPATATGLLDRQTDNPMVIKDHSNLIDARESALGEKARGRLNVEPPESTYLTGKTRRL